MLSDRLKLAFEQGLVQLPEAGKIAVVNAPGDTDIAPLPDERVEIVHRFAPEHLGWTSRGFRTKTCIEGPYALSVLSLPRAKLDTRHTLLTLLKATKGPVLIDGQKTDGIDSIHRDLRKRGEVSPAIAKGHGKIFAVIYADLAGWAETRLPAVEGRFRVAPGIFSADGIDPGSRALADALPARMPGRVADLGAGWGYLADAVLGREAVEAVDLVEADALALDCARINVTDPRAHFHWADATSFVPDAPVDHVVTNPPFHAARRADPSIGQAFILQAARILTRQGRLWLVANRHLPYEGALESAFREVRTLDAAGPYKVLEASRPRRTTRG